MTILVCPHCGSEDFKQERTTRTSYTVRVNDWGFDELESTIVDGGDSDEELVCVECNTHYASELRLVSKREYDTIREREREDDVSSIH